MNYLLVSVFCCLVVAVSIQTGDALSCYTCNSGKMYEGDKCKDGQVSDEYLTDCVELGKTTGFNYTMCRKINQDVEGEDRIFRDCAVTGRNECARRTGTRQITMTYCECKGDKCNTASTLFNNVITITVALSAIVSFLFLKS